jgi:Sec7-like guanine-nucleotide exchange factor
MNDGKDFEESFLLGIYDRIAAQEIRLQDAPLTVDNELSTGITILAFNLKNLMQTQNKDEIDFKRRWNAQY